MKSINPHNNQFIEEFDALTDEEVLSKIEKSWKAFQTYRKTDISTRKTLLKNLSVILEERSPKYGEIIALEMGKPIEESIAEVKKAAKHFAYCSDNLENFIQDDVVKTEFQKSVVEFHPLGPIFFVSPFNFPFWLSVKGSGPALAVGNTILVKVASSCPRVGISLEEALSDAGFNNGEFQVLRTTQSQSELVISHKLIRGVSFTGSSKGGAIVASLAGKYFKKSITELGGNDPMVVLDDGDVDLAVSIAVASRLRNAGQVCTAAKRFLIHKSKYEEFIKKLTEKVSAVKIGDPLKKESKLGPLATKRALETVIEQIELAVKQGAKLVYGGTRPTDEALKDGNYLIPAIFETTEDTILFQEEIFGPVFSVISFETEEEAIRIANNTQYGLSGVVVGKDIERAQKIGKEIEVGFIAINGAVQSDSRLPSGGMKESGFGRECGIYGAREFTNQKTVLVK